MARFSVIIEKDEDGYFARVPAIQGCYAQGDTYEEALENIEDAIKLNILESGHEIPEKEQICLTITEIP